VMNVYLVMYGDTYEGYDVSQAFSNEATALEYMSLAQQDSNSSGDWHIESVSVREENTHRLLFIHEANIEVETGKEMRGEGHQRLTTADTFRNSHAPSPNTKAWNHGIGIGASSVSYEDALQLARDAIAGNVVRDPG
jgi:hypothetical protein